MECGKPIQTIITLANKILIEVRIYISTIYKTSYIAFFVFWAVVAIALICSDDQYVRSLNKEMTEDCCSEIFIIECSLVFID